MLNVDGVSVRRGGVLSLSDVSLTVEAGETLGVIGESGAGKSTLIAAILGLVRPSQGQVTWNGDPVKRAGASLVMQEPRAAFNPALPLGRSVMEPLIGQRAPLDPARLHRLCQGLELEPDILDRRPFEVSIGQAQRVGILRALIAAPPLVLFDEPLSALDAVTQKHTARLIAQVQEEEGFAALIVTHDLGYAASCSDHIAVLRAGQVVERGLPEAFVTAPETPYGRTLRDAAVSLGALERVA